jgi:hypothetical protein
MGLGPSQDAASSRVHHRDAPTRASGTFSKGLERLEPPRRREIFSGCLSSPIRVALGYELAIQQLLQGSSFCERETLLRNASEREQGCNLGLERDSFRHGIEPLIPLEVHPEFQEDALVEVTRRLTTDHPNYVWNPEQSKRRAMKRWLSKCR